MTSERPAPPTAKGERYCPTCDRSFGPDVLRCPEDDTALVRIGGLVDPMVGRDIEGRYTVREFLGAGGMGTVYLAWQHSVGRGVALKVIDSRLCRDAMGVRRFLREAKLASRLSQPNTVSVLDFGQTQDGLFFLAMELLQGRTLDRVLADEGPFSPARLVRVGIQLCDALDAAHALGIVHRDLKPSNIMVLDQPAGRDLVKVLDFGLAKSIGGAETDSTQSGRIIGTPQYMAPEVIQGAEAEATADLYALGVILHELATGEPHLRAKNTSELYAQQVLVPSRGLDGRVPDALEQVILRLLAKEPASRQASAQEVRAALSAAVGLDSGPQPVVTAPHPRTVPIARPALAPGLAAAPPDAPTVVQPIRARVAPAEEPAPVAPVAGVSPPRRASGLAWIGLSALVLAGGGTWLMLSRPAALPAPIMSAPAPRAAPEPALPQAPVAVPAAQPPSVTLRFEGAPGTLVTVGGVAIGRTPVEHRCDRGDRALAVTFERDGQRSARSVVPDRDRAVRVTMPRVREKPPTPRAKPPADPGALPF